MVLTDTNLQQQTMTHSLLSTSVLLLLLIAANPLVVSVSADTASANVTLDVDWQTFLGQHDMVWNWTWGSGGRYNWFMAFCYVLRTDIWCLLVVLSPKILLDASTARSIQTPNTNRIHLHLPYSIHCPAIVSLHYLHLYPVQQDCKLWVHVLQI